MGFHQNIHIRCAPEHSKHDRLVELEHKKVDVTHTILKQNNKSNEKRNRKTDRKRRFEKVRESVRKLFFLFW